MLEIIALIVIAGGIGKVASADGQSAIVWGGVTFLLGIAFVWLVPLPFLRMLAAGIAAFMLFIAYKVIAKK